MHTSIGKLKLAGLAATIVSALLVGAAGCTGPSDNLNTFNPSGNPTANPNSNMSISVVSSGASFLTLPAVNGYSGAITTNVSAGAGANATVEDQTNVPGPPPAFSSGGASCVLYVSIAVTNNVTFTAGGTPALGFAISDSNSPSGSYYLAFYDPTQPSPAWSAAWAGPVTSATNTLTLNYTGTITLKSGNPYWWCLY